jgi:predicted O-methyltransferase YrrM
VSDYDFTADWFVRNEGPWEKIVTQLKPQRIIEIGSFEGRSACWLIDRCSREWPLEIHCIDTWEGSTEHGDYDMTVIESRFDKNVGIALSRSKHPVKLTKHKSTSTAALAQLMVSGAPFVDLVYIDGDHVAAQVLEDAVMSYPLLRAGGLMIFDDYRWEEYWLPPEQRMAQNAPKLGIDNFYNTYFGRMEIVPLGSLDQLYLRKREIKRGIG